jgi:hypothetical protein
MKGAARSCRSDCARLDRLPFCLGAILGLRWQRQFLTATSGRAGWPLPVAATGGRYRWPLPVAAPGGRHRWPPPVTVTGNCAGYGVLHCLQELG